MSGDHHHLNAAHRRELLEHSAIDPAVVAERGYATVGRPTAGDDRPRRQLATLGMPTWAIESDSYFPGLIVPIYGPTGQRVSAQWKPRAAIRDRKGKPIRYASVKGQGSRLDVHPRNTAKLVDPTVDLWITEGVKKADSLTSRGVCVIALAGVFNWRSTLGTLGDWEDVVLRGRRVVVCFDADAWEKPQVLRAMVRLGKWLESRGASVGYLIVPAETHGTSVKGADDFFAAGGTLDELRAAITSRPPDPGQTVDTFTDARMAETVADDVLDGRFVWCGGLGWLEWDGRRWAPCTDVAVGEAVRRYVLDRFAEVAAAARRDRTVDAAVLEGWSALLSLARERAVLTLARGLVERHATDFDADPDLLNVANGVVDLVTGELLPHDPALLMTKLAGAEYEPGATHPDWDRALEAVPADVRPWLQVRLGQGVTGYPPPDDLLLVAQGGGENGKTTTMSAVQRTVGDYFLLASDRILLADPSAHPTELMDLMGARLVVAEETPEARHLSVTRLKKAVGTPQITARRVHQDSITFDASHTFVISTNYRPLVDEVDRGTWRRLALVPFPYTFRKAHEPVASEWDRRGDPTLRDRVRTDPAVQRAVLSWLVVGAMEFYAAGRVMPEPPAAVVAATDAWRRESDPVLGYVDDRLTFDPDAHVMTTELLSDFNSWLESRGHKPWSDKTFGARFGGHERAAGARVYAARVRGSDRLSRPAPSYVLSAPPARYRAWVGVRFATAAELDARVDEPPRAADLRERKEWDSWDSCSESFLHTRKAELSGEPSQLSHRATTGARR